MALSMPLQSEVSPRTERLAMVGEKTSDLVHDLRNMLTSIRAAAELLAMKSEDPALLKIILAQSEAMSQMTEEVMAFVRGEEPVAPEVVDVPEFIDEVVEVHGHLFKRAGIEIEVEVAAEQAVMDRTQMHRALLNLMVNSRDAMPHGGRLRITALPVGKVLRIAVEDNGLGMTPEVAARVFEPYFTSGKPHGTGLGGAVVKAAVEAHGGTVKVESLLGRGTRVTMTLPIEDHAAGRIVREHGAPVGHRQPHLTVV